MKDIKCPLCRNTLKLSTIENKGQLHFYACYKCNYQLRMSPSKDFALEYAKAFVSLFPPIMRLMAGDKPTENEARRAWNYMMNAIERRYKKGGNND